MDRFGITLPLGYVGYFVLGYCLSRSSLFFKKTVLMYLSLLCLLMVVGIAAFTHYVSIAKGSLTEIFYEYMSPAVVVLSSCIFIIAKQLFDSNDFFYSRWYSKYIVLMSKYSLAIYMFHEFILILIYKLGVNPTLFNSLLSVPLIALGIYVVTFISIHIMAKFSFFKNNMM